MLSLNLLQQKKPSFVNEPSIHNEDQIDFIKQRFLNLNQDNLLMHYNLIKELRDQNNALTTLILALIGLQALNIILSLCF